MKPINLKRLIGVLLCITMVLSGTAMVFATDFNEPITETPSERYQYGADASALLTISKSGVVPGASYGFNLTKLKLVEDSDLSANYGRWICSNSIISKDKINMEPGIRVTNKKGSLVLNVSHSSTMITLGGETKTYNTGVFQDWITDRE